MKTFREYIEEDESYQKIWDTLSLKEIKTLFNGEKIPVLKHNAYELDDDFNIGYFVNNPEFQNVVKWFIDNSKKFIKMWAGGENVYIKDIAENFEYFPDNLQVYCFQKFPQHIEEILEDNNISLVAQDYILSQNPTLINKIKNLDPEIAKRYQTSKQGGDAGFF